MMGMAGKEQTKALWETDISRDKKKHNTQFKNEVEIQVKEEIASPRQDMDHKFKESKKRA